MFTKAKAIFIKDKSNEPNTFAQFTSRFSYSSDNARQKPDFTVRITGRSFYRLYINDDMVMHGPARCGHNHARVDEFDISKFIIDGINTVDIEIAGYAGAFFTENDFTAEYSFAAAEILKDGDVVLFTDDSWEGRILYQRDRIAQKHSHSRPIMELWRLDDLYFNRHAIEKTAVETVDMPILWERGVPLPTIKQIVTRNIVSFGAMKYNPERRPAASFFENWNLPYAAAEEKPATECMSEDEALLENGTAKWTKDGFAFDSASSVKYAMFDFGKMYVGFFDLSVTLWQASVVDIVYCDRIEPDGHVTSKPTYNTCIRLYCQAGKTVFRSFEPYSGRYARVIIRSSMNAVINSFGITDYSFDEDNEAKGSFLCDDENINRIYNAAKLTLKLNTLDIFMDCPDRERGGWLCDSLWTGRAAGLMYGDSSVERAMLENFLCLPSDKVFHAFFPSCYPASGDFTGGTILTWTFWLITELEEYYNRTRDDDLKNRFEQRLDAFFKGAEELCDSAGLLETKSTIFIDWSLSNDANYNSPISVPGNALYAYCLDCIDRLYSRPDMAKRAAQIRALLKQKVIDPGNYEPRYIMCDSLELLADGELRAKPFYSESAQYTSLWAGLYTRAEAPKVIDSVVHELGPCPQRKPPQMDITSANMFIGLCIRLDMLSRLGEYGIMLEEIRYLCDEMLRQGPGTLWETLGGLSSRCHGFMAHMGVWLTSDILGINIPRRYPEKTVRIAPHPCGLHFARGTAHTDDGEISLGWSADECGFTLNCSCPPSYTAELEIPVEYRGFADSVVNGEKVDFRGNNVIRLSGSFTVRIYQKQ